MRALIVDPRGERTSVGALRALTAAGWTVGVGGPAGRGAALSRRCDRVHGLAGPELGLDRFREDLNRAIAEGGYEVVLPSGDAELIALADIRDGVDATVPYGDSGSIRRAVDKLELAAAAKRVGLGTPWTAPADTPLPDRLDGPVMVKARSHLGPSAPDRPVRVEAARARTAQELAAQVAELEASGREAILQEIVDGPLLGFVAVVDAQGRMLAAVQQMSWRVWPRAAGTVVRAETVPVDPSLRARVSDLLSDLSWRGLVQLQFLVPADGVPRLIDFNGRFYASVALAVGAGVNVPALWAASATSRGLPPAPRARPGVRYQWLEGDLRLAADRRGTALVVETLGCMRYAVRARHGLWALDDPRPAIGRVREVFDEDAGRLPRLVRRAVPASSGAGSRH